jgi:hypothetical protein
MFCACVSAVGGRAIFLRNFDWMSLLKKLIKSIALASFVLSIIFFAGCGLDGQPRPRVGSYPASSIGSKFLDIDDLGTHSYGLGFGEHNGLVYTSRGGHIDIAHLRIAADNTKALYYKTRQNIINGNSEFTFKLNVEPSQYYVELEYPNYWQTISPQYREKIADKLALEMSQYFTYTMTTWHEVLTWFGFKCVFFLPEKESAFSWEDIYSNLLGTRLGAQALQDKEHNFNEAMTILLKNELETLGAQPSRTARQAARLMKDKYFDGRSYLDPTRSMDIGLYDGLVTPVLIPGVCIDAEPKSYPVPALAAIKKYGFRMNLEIHPKEFESGKILRVVYPNGGGDGKIHPAEQLPIVMDYIKKDAIRQGFAVRPTEVLTVSSLSVPQSKDASVPPNL